MIIIATNCLVQWYASRRDLWQTTLAVEAGDVAFSRIILTNQRLKTLAIIFSLSFLVTASRQESAPVT